MVRKKTTMQSSAFYNSIKLKSGYFLLEFVIYIATSIILGSSIFVLLSGIYKAMPRSVNRVNQYTKLILSSDRLAQDILTNNLYINKIDKDILQLQTEQGCIKWFINNERLIRQFIPITIKQNNKNIAVVCNNIKSFFYMLDIRNNELIGINYKIIMTDNLFVENYIAIRTNKFKGSLQGSLH